LLLNVGVYVPSLFNPDAVSIFDIDVDVSCIFLSILLTIKLSDDSTVPVGIENLLLCPILPI